MVSWMVPWTVPVSVLTQAGGHYYIVKCYCDLILDGAFDLVGWLLGRYGFVPGGYEYFL